jgi:hypothetical protein
MSTVDTETLSDRDLKVRAQLRRHREVAIENVLFELSDSLKEER